MFQNALKVSRVVAVFAETSSESRDGLLQQQSRFSVPAHIRERNAKVANTGKRQCVRMLAAKQAPVGLDYFILLP